MKQLSFLILFFGITFAFAHEKQSFKNVFNKTFMVNELTNFYIYNFSGDVDVELWLKNEVELTVTYEVITPKIAKGEQFLRALTVRVESDSNNIRVSSIVDKNLLDNSFYNGRSEYHFYYHLKVPVYLNLSIENKYGNINLPELSGNINVRLSNGKLFVQSFTTDETKNTPQIILKNAKCTILKANNLIVTADYSNVKITNALTINLNTNYSSINIADVFSLIHKSNKDKIQYDKISKLNINAAYSKVDINFIKTDLQCNLKYSQMTINDLYENFNTATFDLFYSDTDIYINKQTCSNISAEARYGRINLPQRSNVNNYITPISMKTEGTIGCISGAVSNLNINGQYSDINIVER